MNDTITQCIEHICNGGNISFDESLQLLSIEHDDAYHALIEAGHTVFRHFCGTHADLCSLVNAKSGRCTEDCAFCAQAGQYATGIETFPLRDSAYIVQRACEAAERGAHRFCIVTSGGRLTTDEFAQILEAYKAIRKKTSIALDGSLGILDDAHICALKDVGVTRINHNLETSERFFPHICTTHTFQDRYNTIKRLKYYGFEVCSGGIIGMGEERVDRISWAFSLKSLRVDCIPINILNPRPGTPLALVERLSHKEIIKTIAVLRLIFPSAVIKIAGGREVNLGDAQPEALRAGANGIIINGYLTTCGNPVTDDIALIQSAGLDI